MKPIRQDTFDRLTLNASLQRLGVVELDERLEFSPLLAEGGWRGADGEQPCCLCKMPTGGDGSTGPYGDGLNW